MPGKCWQRLRRDQGLPRSYGHHRENNCWKVSFMTSTEGGERDSVIVSAHELFRLIRLGQAPVVITVVREQTTSASEIVSSPNHVTLSIRDFQGEGGGTRGDRPLPDLDILTKTLTDRHIGADADIVVYSPDGPLLAARAWFTLHWAGRSVRYLDGGMAAWTAAIEQQTNADMPIANAPTRSVEVSPADADDAARAATTGILLDSRSPSSFHFQGHISGAVSAPALDVLDESGFLLPDAELREHFRQFGIESSTPVVSYCGGGVAASHNALALAAIGISSAVYIASWSGWSADPERPVSTRIHHTSRNPEKR